MAELNKEFSSSGFRGAWSYSAGRRKRLRCKMRCLPACRGAFHARARAPPRPVVDHNHLTGKFTVSKGALYSSPRGGHSLRNLLRGRQGAWPVSQACDVGPVPCTC